jgi:hypothetical protein
MIGCDECEDLKGLARNTVLNCDVNHLGQKMGKGFIPKREMIPEVSIRVSDTGQRYDALLRISEALSACGEPEDLTSILSDHLRDSLEFFQFYILVYKENSTDAELAVVGSEKSLNSAYADERVPARLKQGNAVFKSDRWFLYPSRHRIGAWAPSACQAPQALFTVPKTFRS